jgi:hypothetical protein
MSLLFVNRFWVRWPINSSSSTYKKTNTTSANVKFIHAINCDQLLPGFSSPEIIITRNKINGSFRAAAVSILKRDAGRWDISTTLDTEDSDNYDNLKTDVQALRELYEISQVTLGELRDRSIEEPLHKGFYDAPKPGVFGGPSNYKLAAWLPVLT